MKEITFQTITRWIDSCLTHDQLNVTTEAIHTMYIERYSMHGTQSSQHLINLATEKASELTNGTDIYNLDVPGKD
jgi:hypothetical protein